MTHADEGEARRSCQFDTVMELNRSSQKFNAAQRPGSKYGRQPASGMHGARIKAQSRWCWNQASGRAAYACRACMRRTCRSGRISLWPRSRSTPASPARMRCMICASCCPAHGCRPVHAWSSVTPRAHTSTAAVYAELWMNRFSSCSGALHAG